MDWCQYTDYLQCSPSFHGQARHDCAIFRTQQHDIFTQTIFLFTCSIGDEKFPLALIQPYDVGLVGQQLSKDNHLGFWRVREQSRASTEIFSVHSIIRGALLYPDNTRPGEHLVIDTAIQTCFFVCKKCTSLQDIIKWYVLSTLCARTDYTEHKTIDFFSELSLNLKGHVRHPGPPSPLL